MTAPLKRYTKTDVDRHVAEAVAANNRDQLISALKQRADDSNHLDVKMGERFDTLEGKVDRLKASVDVHEGYFEALGIPSLSALERGAFPKMLRLALKLDWLGHGIGKALAICVSLLMVVAAVLSVIQFALQHVHT